MADLPLRLYILQAHHNPLTNTGTSREEEELESEFQKIPVLYDISNLRRTFSMLFLLDSIPSAHIKDRLCRYCLAIGRTELHRISAMLSIAKRNVNGILEAFVNFVEHVGLQYCTSTELYLHVNVYTIALLYLSIVMLHLFSKYQFCLRCFSKKFLWLN